MTIVASWVRTIRDAEELVFVSDSRVSGDGRYFDAAPKIITLPRSDCAIAFAGFTGHAFPMMLQLGLAISSYEPLRRRAMEITALKTHTLKIFDRMADLIVPDPRTHGTQESLSPEAEFVIGGYSWVQKRFELWTIAFNQSEKRFRADPVGCVGHSERAGRITYRRSAVPRGKGPYSRVAFAGDQARDARQRLLSRLTEKHKAGADFEGLDWEPFEVVRDMLRERDHAATIGGAPQIVKVYQYMHTAPVGVFWPNRSSGAIYLQGRPCLGYENIDRWVIDPDTLRTQKQSRRADSSAKPTGGQGCPD